MERGLPIGELAVHRDEPVLFPVFADPLGVLQINGLVVKDGTGRQRQASGKKENPSAIHKATRQRSPLAQPEFIKKRGALDEDKPLLKAINDIGLVTQKCGVEKSRSAGGGFGYNGVQLLASHKFDRFPRAASAQFW